MDKLREIMSDLTDIEYSLEAFSSLLEDLEEVYDLRHDEERKENVWLFRILLDSLCENLSDKISEIDRFILDSRKK